MSDLWAPQRAERLQAAEPLAARRRPAQLDEYIGQEHLLGEGKLLRRLVTGGQLGSLILHGPPGCGKTTLAILLGEAGDNAVERENASALGVARLRVILAEAKRRIEEDRRRTTLLLDEIHRFSRNQQDVLLDGLESGVLQMIGTTTENPTFACNAALISRSTVLALKPLSEESIVTMLRRAMRDDEQLARLAICAEDDALMRLAILSTGDARRALRALEVAALSLAAGAEPGETLVLDIDTAETSIQRALASYDGTGTEHFDVTSALIKSMRASDEPGAMQWLARMLDAGEDPRFIARRIAIFASEDVGIADPQAITVASAAWLITERVGLPECRITLAHAVSHMARAPKSRAAIELIDDAMRAQREERSIAVPEHLKNTPH